MSNPIRDDDDFLVFGKPAFEKPEIDEVVDSLESAWPGTGPKAQAFEEAFADYVGAEHAIALNSCTAALHLALEHLDLQPEDEVITTPLTFCASVNAIIHAGGTPVLADVDPGTMNLDPESVKEAITPRTRAILPVHFAGRPCDMPALMELADSHGLTVVEDCAHAIETTFEDQHAGTFGEFGCYSFYATKNVVTGEGGMIVTDDEEAARHLRTLSLHGMSQDAWKRYSDAGYQHYQVVEPGFKYNMMDLQAALGLHQLDRVEQNWRHRDQLWEMYDDALGGLPVTTPQDRPAEGRHALHLYTLLIDEAVAGLDRDAFLNAMNDENIGTGVHYLSVPEHPFYRERYGWDPADTPNATRIGRQTVSLPFGPSVARDDALDVVAGVKKVLGSSTP